MANEIARSLRKQMTPQEVKLWIHLRSWRTKGYHFRRQTPLDGYILDFLCFKDRLVVEIDGGQHNFEMHAQRDAKRDDHFAGQGYRILRFWNHEVDQNLEGVLHVIDEALCPTRPAPAKGRGRPPSPTGRD